MNKARASSASKPVKGHLKGSGEEWTRYGSTSEAARALDLHRGNISKCANKKYNSTDGYEFEFDDPTEPSVLPGEEWTGVM